MKEELRIIKKYLLFKEELLHKKDMGYALSKTELKDFSSLKEKALDAKHEVKKETKQIKKLLKKVK